MHQETYKVMDGNVTLATGMNLETACILVKALFETYYLETDISYEIVKEVYENTISTDDAEYEL